MKEELPEFPRYDLNDRVAVVTGGSWGLGTGIALGLAQAGTEVLVAFRENRTGAEETSHSIDQIGRKAVPWLIDVADVHVVDATITAPSRELGDLDIIVNYAGVGFK